MQRVSALSAAGIELISEGSLSGAGGRGVRLAGPLAGSMPES
jgi:hypothetical protein